jgi:3-methyladenine DNA glycosylase AlkD
MPADAELLATIRADLAAHGDPERAVHQQAYMKSALPFHGLSSPQLRALLKPHLATYAPADRAEWEATVRELWDTATHREEWYAALSIARHRVARQWRDPASLPLWRHLVLTGAWWDVCDEIAGHLVGDVLARHRIAVTPVIFAWVTDDDLWVRRVSVLCQHLLGADTDLDLLTHAIEANLDDTSFWMRKAIGWALRDHSRVDPDWVTAFVDRYGDRMSGLSRREALRRIHR